MLVSLFMETARVVDSAGINLSREYGVSTPSWAELTLQESRIPYGLKEVYRFSQLANRKESDFDHVGSMHTLARWLVRTHDLRFDVARMTDMISMHDLHELLSGDTPIIPGVNNQVDKDQREAQAIEKLVAMMSPEEGAYYLGVISEYKQGKTELAKFIRGVDKLEADIQCLTCKADWEGWTETFYRKKRDPYYQAVPILNEYYEKLLTYLRAGNYFCPDITDTAAPAVVTIVDEKFSKLVSELLIPFSLKEVTRQGLAGTRYESVMEHVGSAIMLARFLMRKLNLDLDVAKVVDLLVMHDLHEVVSGDVPLTSVKQTKEEKEKAEADAIQEIARRLSPQDAVTYLAIMKEYKHSNSAEVKFFRAIDALDAGIQCLSNKEQWAGWTEGFYRSKRDSLFENVPELKPFYECLVSYLVENGYFSQQKVSPQSH